MSDYIIVNGELRAVTSNTNSLQHWKYISKKKGKNGKWNYKYPKDSKDKPSNENNKRPTEFNKTLNYKNPYDDEQTYIQTKSDNEKYEKYVTADGSDEYYKLKDKYDETEFYKSYANITIGKNTYTYEKLHRNPVLVTAVLKGKRAINNIFKKISKKLKIN